MLPYLFLLILITSCSEKDKPDPDPVDILTSAITDELEADSIKNYIEWLQGMGTRFALADNRREIAVRIRDKFISFGYPDTELDSFWLSISRPGMTFEGWQYNIIATLEGDIYPDSVCILGAHYDDASEPENRYTNAPGANDNASGVAAALETARVLKKMNFIPSNTIKFVAFGAEETGLNGSYVYVDEALDAGEKIKIMLNNDMIAIEAETKPTDWEVNIIDYDNSHDKRLLAQELCQQYTSLDYVNINTYSQYSDSYPFASHGYKALFFTSYDPDNTYHTIYDVSGNCNFEYCSQVAEISCAMLVYESVPVIIENR